MGAARPANVLIFNALFKAILSSDVPDQGIRSIKCKKGSQRLVGRLAVSHGLPPKRLPEGHSPVCFNNRHRLIQFRSLWERFFVKILVTGGAGYIGGTVAGLLHEQGHEASYCG